jgi:hypothetical protein
VRLVESLDRRIAAQQADVRGLARLEKVVRSGGEELGRLDGVVADRGIHILEPGTSPSAPSARTYFRGPTPTCTPTHDAAGAHLARRRLPAVGRVHGGASVTRVAVAIGSRIAELGDDQIACR